MGWLSKFIGPPVSHLPGICLSHRHNMPIVLYVRVSDCVCVCVFVFVSVSQGHPITFLHHNIQYSNPVFPLVHLAFLSFSIYGYVIGVEC